MGHTVFTGIVLHPMAIMANLSGVSPRGRMVGSVVDWDRIYEHVVTVYDSAQSSLLHFA